VDYYVEKINSEPIMIYRFPAYEQQVAAGAGITGRDGKFILQNRMINDIPLYAVK